MLSHLPLLSTLADSLPPIGRSQLGANDVEVVPVVLIGGAAAAYLWGVARLKQRHPHHRWAWWRTASFMAGLLATALAVMSFIGVYDGELFWDHMVQHLLLIMVAAPLFAVGSPLALAFRSSRGRWHRAVALGLRSPPARFFGNPLVAFGLYALFIPVAHLTSFYNYTLLHETVHDLEHLAFLVAGYLFWRQVFGIEPNRYRMHPALQLAYLFFAVPVDTFTGLSLASTSRELFPAYTAMHRPWGPSLVTDLHIGGVIMWVGGDSLMLLGMIPVAIHWMRSEERRAVRVDRELDRMLPGREPPSRRRTSVFKPAASGLGRDAPLPQGPPPPR